MKHFHKEFFEEGVVDGETIAEKLANEKVIPERLKKKLAKEDDEYQITSAIFNHVKKQGDYESLEALCTIMKNEGGMKKMNKLGKKMLDCLVASEFTTSVLYIHNIMFPHMVYMHSRHIHKGTRYVFACMHVHVHTHTHTHMYASTHMHTQTHAYTRPRSCT